MYISVVISSLSALGVFLCDEFDFLPFSRESSSSQILFSNDSGAVATAPLADLRVGMELRHCQ